MQTEFLRFLRRSIPRVAILRAIAARRRSILRLANARAATSVVPFLPARRPSPDHRSQPFNASPCATPLMARSQNMNALRFGSGFAVATAVAVWTGLFFTGCAALSTRDLARVVVAPAPVASTSASLATLPEDDPRRPLILSEAGRFADPHSVKFFAAREAFWDYDTDTAVRLLRELRQAEAMSEAHFHTLVLQCYEQSGRWTDAVSAYREFKLEESHPGPLNHARFRSSLPRREVAFAAQPEDVPIRLRNGGWVSAEGTINGTRGRFGLDTGAGLSWVSERFARRAGIDITSQTVSLRDSNNSERIVPIGLIRELRLAGLTVRHAPVVVDRSLVMDVLGGEDAIVGWEILQQADIVWDFPAGRMTIAAPAGSVSAAPNLSGRVAPILTVLSSAGRPIEFFFDSGAAANRRGCGTLFDNEGVLATKLAIEEFRPSLLPSVGGGMHSVAVSWPRRARPFSFWMGGNRFELASAALSSRVHQREELVLVDGVIGNAPFLGGKLRICGVRRELVYEPATAATGTQRANLTAGNVIASGADPSRRTRVGIPARESAPPLDLATSAADCAALSQAAWREANVGWGRPVRNRFWVADDLVTQLVLQGQVFDQGLYAHSPSRYVFALDGRWKTFAAVAGLRDGAHPQGSAVFTVRGDGRDLYASPLLRAGARAEIKVDVSGVRQLELVAEGGEGHPHNSWAIWADPRVER